MSRPAAPTGVGTLPYGGLQTANETPIASGLPASIQMNKIRGRPEAGLPGDGDKSTWRIFIPASAAALGLILVRDVITDDLGQRYQVVAPYWASLGHTLTCERLEA